MFKKKNLFDFNGTIIYCKRRYLFEFNGTIIYWRKRYLFQRYNNLSINNSGFVQFDTTFKRIHQPQGAQSDAWSGERDSCTKSIPGWLLLLVNQTTFGVSSSGTTTCFFGLLQTGLLTMLVCLNIHCSLWLKFLCCAILGCFVYRASSHFQRWDIDRMISSYFFFSSARYT